MIYVAIHQYSCTCPDSLVRLTICKHIHLVSRKLYPDYINRSKPTPTNVITGDQKIKDHNNAKILQEATISSKKILASSYIRFGQEHKYFEVTFIAQH